MRVARQIGQYGLRPREGSLGVDHPLSPAHRREPGLECMGIGQAGVLAEERQLAAVVQPLQLLQEAPPEKP